MSATNDDVSVIIPIRNARAFAERQIAAIQRQTLRPTSVIVIDSESSDGSPDTYRAAGYSVVSIPVTEFDHGATRNLGLSQCSASIVVYLTHDSIPRDQHALERLCAPFSDPTVGIVSGRQLPRGEAGAIERHGRLFNYSMTSERRSWPNARNLGFRAIFNSNAFAAYRRQALEHIGGFPEGVIFGEDQVAAGRALLQGWTVAYVGDAEVEHSHGYSPMAEFRRYFDIGVCAKTNRDLFAHFGGTTGEGRRFVISEMKYLLRHAPYRIPEAGLRTTLKLLGYHIGKHETLLPASAKRQIAMNPMFFTHNER